MSIDTKSVAPYAKARERGHVYYVERVFPAAHNLPLLTRLRFHELIQLALAQPCGGVLFAPLAKVARDIGTTTSMLRLFISTGLLVGSDDGPVAPHVYTPKRGAAVTLLTPPAGLPCWYMPAILVDDFHDGEAQWHKKRMEGIAA